MIYGDLSHLARKLRSLFIISGQIVSSVLNRNFLPCLEPKMERGGTWGKQKCYPSSNYLFKINSRNTRKRCEICPMITKKKHQNGVIDVINFQHISHVFLVCLLLTLNKYMSAWYMLEGLK